MLRNDSSRFHCIVQSICFPKFGWHRCGSQRLDVFCNVLVEVVVVSFFSSVALRSWTSGNDLSIVLGKAYHDLILHFGHFFDSV